MFIGGTFNIGVNLSLGDMELGLEYLNDPEFFESQNKSGKKESNSIENVPLKTEEVVDDMTKQNQSNISIEIDEDDLFDDTDEGDNEEEDEGDLFIDDEPDEDTNEEEEDFFIDESDNEEEDGFSIEDVIQKVPSKNPVEPINTKIVIEDEEEDLFIDDGDEQDDDGEDDNDLFLDNEEDNNNDLFIDDAPDDEDEIIIPESVTSNLYKEPIVKPQSSNETKPNELSETHENESLSLKEKELALREKELALKEKELQLQLQQIELEKLKAMNYSASDKQDNEGNIQEIDKDNKKDVKTETEKLVPKEAPKSSDRQALIDKYASMNTDTLYRYVKGFMLKNGVKSHPIEGKMLNDKFGTSNIARLIKKSYLIKLNNNCITCNK